MTEAIPDLKGKTALVTGASRGIGRAAAIAYAKAGAHILAIARTAGALEELDDDIRASGGTATLIPFDLTEGDGIERLAATVAERFEKLDILFANAAILGELAPLTHIEPKVWLKTLDLNVTVNWRLIRAFDALLRKSDDGRAVFLTSRVGGEVPRAFWGGYAVSKAALEMLAKTYAEETRNANVTVAILDPASMRTAMRAQAMPGEDPESLPSPKELTPLFYEAATGKWEGANRLSFREWAARQSG